MERGLYAAATGMMVQQTIQDVLAQNLANVNTPGFKQDVPTFKTVHGLALQRAANGSAGTPIGELGTGVATDRSYTDWRPGPLATTNNPLDASLADGQFFAVQTASGTAYTRAGNFQVNGAGALTTASGNPVLGSDGKPITITGSIPPRIGANGAVTVNGAPVAKLNIVEADRDALTPAGETLFTSVRPAGIRSAARPEVRPGTLEQSNVNMVSGMVRMISVSRAFEMAQRAVVTQDEMLKHAANDLGHL